MGSIWKSLVSGDEKFFDFNIKFLVVVGLWPPDNWTKFQKLLYQIVEVIIHILSAIFLVITGIGIYQHIDDDVTVLLSNIDKYLVAYNFILKAVVFVWNRDKIRSLIHKIGRSGDTMTEYCRKLMTTHVVFVTLFSTAIISGISAAAQYKFEMTVDAWMPFDPMKNRKNLFLAAQVLAITFVPASYRCCAMQGIVCSLIMYICDQLMDLQTLFKKLKYHPEFKEDFRKQFKEIVKKHVRIMGYCKSMEENFKDFFLIQNLAITLELCLNALVVSTLGLQKKLVNFIAFLISALLNGYIYCYLGNEMIIQQQKYVIYENFYQHVLSDTSLVTDDGQGVLVIGSRDPVYPLVTENYEVVSFQSEGISLAAYESGWSSWPVDLQKDLLLVIRAAQKPLAVRAGGVVPMSIATFGQALYNGYSIFAVLNDVVD